MACKRKTDLVPTIVVSKSSQAMVRNKSPSSLGGAIPKGSKLCVSNDTKLSQFASQREQTCAVSHETITPHKATVNEIAYSPRRLQNSRNSSNLYGRKLRTKSLGRQISNNETASDENASRANPEIVGSKPGRVRHRSATLKVSNLGNKPISPGVSTINPEKVWSKFQSNSDISKSDRLQRLKVSRTYRTGTLMGGTLSEFPTGKGLYFSVLSSVPIRCFVQCFNV